jgi:hypothetical protein
MMGLRYIAIVCPYYLQFGHIIVKGSLWGPTCPNRCAGNSILARIGCPHKGLSYNFLPNDIGEKQKLVEKQETILHFGNVTLLGPLKIFSNCPTFYSTPNAPKNKKKFLKNSKKYFTLKQTKSKIK